MTPIPFTGNPLDRASDRRSDPSWIAELWADPDAAVWPFWNLQPLLLGAAGGAGESAKAGFVRRGLLNGLPGPEAALYVFLGLDNGRPIFAFDIPAAADIGARVAEGGCFSEARAAAQLLPASDAAIMGQAKALLDWHRRHGFCPNCGSRTGWADGGYRRHCDACGADHFPRTDPVVIMLTLHEEACLVGRAPRFPKDMFSALAGFVEPGETIEEAVAREVLEEAGVRVQNVSYFATQPWPFPSSLMIGCFAQADDRRLLLDKKELAEAFWLEKTRLRRLLAGEPDPELRVPPPIAIAHHLLKRFAEM